MDKPNARELAIESIWQKILDHFASNNWHLNEGTVKDILSKGIDAYLATPSESATETAMRIYYDCFLMGNGKFEAEKAAALIEGYGRRVPREMLEEIFEQYPCYIPGKEPNAVRMCIDAIAAKHGVMVF